MEVSPISVAINERKVIAPICNGALEVRHEASYNGQWWYTVGVPGEPTLSSVLPENWRFLTEIAAETLGISPREAEDYWWGVICRFHVYDDAVEYCKHVFSDVVDAPRVTNDLVNYVHVRLLHDFSDVSVDEVEDFLVAWKADSNCTTEDMALSWLDQQCVVSPFLYPEGKPEVGGPTFTM
jgi:hypothetical protein